MTADCNRIDDSAVTPTSKYMSDGGSDSKNGVGLRHRKGDIDDKSQVVDSSPMAGVTACPGDNVDPIYWFGGLVSPFLRQSQKEFRIGTYI